ncbi:MAG TPA: class I SAM-dependent methyltransferase [Bacteroidales bacterium]|nr:class I SAM-dependent methyltransferase [Bacteroidales bacterium]
MSQQQWDSRYSAEEYIYGIEPNEYLRYFLDSRKPGRILFPAEGEGRNAVYAASLGWQVDAFDQSEAGRQKALKLAAMKGVSINYGLISLEDWQPDSNIYDAVALVFVHLEPAFRVEVHRKAIKALKSGGFIIVEAFTKNQFPRTSGGPKNLDLLFDAGVIKNDFAALKCIDFAETQVELNEGLLHRGLADVVRLIAMKQ